MTEGGNTVFGDLAQMGYYLKVVLPRLSYCKVASRNDWFYLSMCSQFAQLFGNRYLVKYIAWCASANAGFAETDYERTHSMCARLPDGEVKLHSALPLLDASPLGFHVAVRLGTEAYWRKDVRLLDAALERVCSYGPDSSGSGSGELEFLLLLSCREKLKNGTANLADLFSQLSKADVVQQKVYELDTMHLLMSDADPGTIGMLARGFSLFKAQSAEG
jgi:hypothetical protein